MTTTPEPQPETRPDWREMNPEAFTTETRWVRDALFAPPVDRYGTPDLFADQDD